MVHSSDMSDPLRRLAAPTDAKGRIVAIFVGAVLLPSLALSVLSFHAVPKQAEFQRIQMKKNAERVLSYVEEDLSRAARAKALQAAKALGAERLLDGRPDVIEAALVDAGIGSGIFEVLRLEASSPAARLAATLGDRWGDVETLHEALQAIDEPAKTGEEDSLFLSGGDSKIVGVLRFRYACNYVHGEMVRQYFEHEFPNPERAMVIRVAEPSGQVLYETAPTDSGAKFEVKREMSGPSFRGLKLYLRYKDRSIEDEVRRWAIAKTVMIGFIDLMLGAGLLLVYSNVRREMQVSKLKSDFVANVSHELKTPLALIRLFSETLELGRVHTEEKAREYYRVINKESQRLTQLINNILDFSRIEAGRREYNFAKTDVTRVVEEVLDAYRFQIEQHGFQLEVELGEDVPELSVDKEALGQALINLLNNALKYSREEKHVKVEVRRDGRRVLICVSDRGIGIPKSEQKKIFEKFYRAENSLVHETKGSGLGLSLVQHIMEAHGGGVEVESAPGKGSRFSLVLPISGGEAA
jgi:signal transduction histidine kinase